MAEVRCAVSDLFFSSKITSTAEAVGTPLVVVREPRDLLEKNQKDVTLVIIDLNLSGADPLEMIRAARTCSDARVIAFVSHVDQQRAAAAQQAGAHEVLPRSKFSALLPQILQDAGSHGPLTP